MGWEMKANNGTGGQYEIPPEGTVPAVLVALIDLGTQASSYQGEAREAHQVCLVWEMPGEKLAGMKDANHLICRAFTLSLHEKSALRSIVSKWRGKELVDGEPFNLATLLGRPCLLSIVHKQSGAGRTYAKVEGVSGLVKGMTVPPPQHQPFAWSLDDMTSTDDCVIPITQQWLPYLMGRPICETVYESREFAQRRGHTEPVTAGTTDAHPGDAPDGEVAF